MRNFTTPSVYGIGYKGEGKYSKATHLKFYNMWVRMLQRCYDDKYHEKEPTYIECTVASRWHNFQNFCSDIEQMAGHDRLAEGWNLDKDIIYRDNCNYSRKTCCLVPQELNKLTIKSNSKRGNLPIGVSFSKAHAEFSKCYKSACRVNGKQKTIGVFSTPKEAFLAYKKAKEKEIKRVAYLYKNEIDPRAYDALLNYKVRIDD